jgi:hypothetical protein
VEDDTRGTSIQLGLARSLRLARRKLNYSRQDRCMCRAIIRDDRECLYSTLDDVVCFVCCRLYSTSTSSGEQHKSNSKMFRVSKPI